MQPGDGRLHHGRPCGDGELSSGVSGQLATPRSAVVAELLRCHGRTYAAEAGIDLGVGDVQALFQLLCLSLLLSARIRARVAVRASQALTAAGWATPVRMRAGTWERRTQVLNGAGYARYDERTARMLGASADLVVSRYGGDLDRLRDRAGHQRAEELRLLQEFPGIGPLGASIFAREVQGCWQEVHPFADARALDVAGRLGLGRDVDEISTLVPTAVGFAHLVAALVRCALERDEAGVLERVRLLSTGR